MEVNWQAPVVARDEIFVEASSGTVWVLQTNVTSWPLWRSDVSRAELEGEIEVGSIFRWRSVGFDVVSTVREVEHGRRLGWTGRALGTQAAHAWTFDPREGGVLVRPLRRTMRRTLEGSLMTWLADLKRGAERA